MPSPPAAVSDDERLLLSDCITSSGDHVGLHVFSDLVLSARDLRRSVNGTYLMPALSFELRPGQVIFFTGPSGCGKSTALRLLANLDPPDGDGSPIKLGSLTPSEMTSPQWRSRVMYVSQSRISQVGSPATLFETATKFVVRAHSPVRFTVKDDLLPICSKIGLTAAQAHQDWQELSGGQAQRASLAIAIALRPSVLLLDECTSALDKKSAVLVESLIQDLCEHSGTAVIWVSHDVEQPERMKQVMAVDCIDFSALWEN